MLRPFKVLFKRTIFAFSLPPSAQNSLLEHLRLRSRAKKQRDGKRAHGDISNPHSVTGRELHISCGSANSDVTEMLSHAQHCVY